MAKKEKSPEQMVETLLTKVKPIFTQDLYIKDNLLLFAGPNSDENLCGDAICTIHPEYVASIKEVFGEHPLTYIQDVAEFKKDVKNNPKKILDESSSEYKKLAETQSRINDVSNGTSDWLSLGNGALFEKIKTAVFESNSFIKLKDETSGGFTIIGKKMFPGLTVTGLSGVCYKFDHFKYKDLNALTIVYPLEPVDVTLVYYFLKIADEGDAK